MKTVQTFFPSFIHNFSSSINLLSLMALSITLASSTDSIFGGPSSNLEELRERYDLMIQEMVILVQHKDPELAREIHATRLLLWSYLSDPEKYKFI